MKLVKYAQLHGVTGLKTTFHFKISIHGQHAMGEIQRNNYSHENCEPSLQGKVSSRLLLKATSHSTLFDIPMRPLREDQKHQHRF